eukprot:TRINITY_DN7237_c0_g1_i1.p1 TRINITY_DN7237_c0_g1~~TRINITY_DN7237_c0_g1_i1.p1  ORF type:complete len:784 (-),score=144.00 TRINITY_DN7237_c0_g1_i1:8-2359(-)
MADDRQFRLSAEIYGHEADVRKVREIAHGLIVSVSRDNTTRIWHRESATSLVQLKVLTGHLRSVLQMGVSSVIYIPPGTGTNFPKGALVTSGWDDNTIIVWAHPDIEMSTDPITKLTGHEATVTSVSYTPNGDIISGSVDKTVRIWKLNGECKTLTGHEHIVWTVLGLSNGTIASGSADKTIRLWSDDQCIRVLTAHVDAVRDLSLYPGIGFLSCSNDCSVRLWTNEGENIQSAHDESALYIYTVSVLPTQEILSGGEREGIKVWRDGNVTQKIGHPSSIWSICGLSNGDILTGGSDGAIRIFSRDPTRQAPEDILQSYDARVIGSQPNPGPKSGQMVGDLNLNQLSGPEALLQPGKQNGQILLVRNAENQAELYYWSESENKWIKEGAVVGAIDTEAQSETNTINGVPYQYVFKIDIGDGYPARRIGYNLGDDVYSIANKFLFDNNLPEEFSDQIVEYIIKNTPASSAARVPFSTGRYIPGASSQQVAGPPPISKPKQQQPPPTVSYFPQQTFISFPTANYEAIQKKITQINAELTANEATKSFALSDLETKYLFTLFSSLSTPNRSVNSDQIRVLKKMLGWPENQRFPALDLCRLIVMSNDVAKSILSEHTQGEEAIYSQDLFNLVLQNGLKSKSPSCMMLSLRFLSNLFQWDYFGPVLLELREDVLDSSADLVSSDNKAAKLALTMLLLNYAVYFLKFPNRDGKTQCLSLLNEIIESSSNTSDDEVVFAALVALGTLIYKDEESCQLVRDLGTKKGISAHLNSSTTKVKRCAQDLVKFLQ